MAQSIEALVNPVMLVWARKNANMKLEYVAESQNISVEKLRGWENGEIRPTINQAQALAKKYRQMFTILYLSEPPYPLKDRQLEDFRRLEVVERTENSSSLYFAVRDAFEKREILLELCEKLEWNVPQFGFKASLSDDPDIVGEKLRSYIGITLEIQKKWRTKNFFDMWRRVLHEKGIIVLQATSVPLEEMRGFSIAAFPFPVVVVNRKDAEAGRVFTIFHELAHISLRLSGICDLNESQLTPEVMKVETWCNRVAAAALVPEPSLLQETEVAEHGQGIVAWTDTTLRYLACRYGVSAEVILRRLLTLELTSQDYYEERRTQWQIEYAKSIQARKGGFIPPAMDAISAYGKDYSMTAFEAYRANKISFSDLSSYLGLKFNQLNKARAILEGAL